MATVTVREVAPAVPAWRDFLSLPCAVYRGDASYSAPSRAATVAALTDPEVLPRQRLLVAYEGEQPVARLSARLSSPLKTPAGVPYGLVGFFEALHRPAAVSALFREAISWLQAAGAGEIVGPLDADTWHRYRVNAGPFRDPPFLLEPYNPPYYERLFAESGFEVLERYASSRVENLAAVAAALRPRAEEARAAGYRLRPLELSRFEEELATLYRLSCRIFAGNFLYSEISESAFLGLYAGARSILDPSLVLFAHPPAGEEAGFLFAYPDHFRAVAALRGQADLPARLRFLAQRYLFGRRPLAVNFKTVGVAPEHRRAGVGALLVHGGYERARERGFRAANHCLYKDDNPSAQLDHGHGRLLRRYELYRWAGTKGS